MTKTCAHCGNPMQGSAGLTLANTHYYLCHPDTGMDCYRLVTVFQHPVSNCPCTGYNGAWTNEDVDLLLDAWMAHEPAPRELTDRLPHPPSEFFQAVIDRFVERVEDE